MNKMLAMAILAAAGTTAAGDWPLVVIRHTGGINDNPKVFERLMESHLRHRGACDEFWFAGGGRSTPERLAAEAAKIAAFRPLCEKAGMLLSYQQGMTLGHGALHDGTSKPDEQVFPDDAWQVDRYGKRMGILCPRAPAALEYERMYAKTIIGVAKPASYWLDDDLRLGISHAEGCFCQRCLDAFNKKTGGSWTRETLVAKLFSKTVREPVRAAWIAFNSESLALFAAEARRAADELGSDCRLAYQAVWSDTIYTGPSYRPILEALSGPGRKTVGIRPGASFYVEAEPRGMVRKCLSVAREAERCRDYGPLVASVCYEQETYPRHVLHKSPGAIMTECALALASGCNSLSLYWYSHSAPEPIEEYDRFVRTLAAARPYFERLAASTRRTRLGGVARFVGSAAAETAGFDLRDGRDFDLACAGIPVTVAESGVKVWYLTSKSRDEMTEADKATLAAGAVVKVDDVKKYPLASRRKKLLDDLDAATNGAFPVRVDACRALRILPRVRPDGTLDSVTILNLSIGDTDELKVRVRNPVSTRAVWQDAKLSAAVPLSCAPGSAPNESVVTIANMAGWQIGTIFFEPPVCAATHDPYDYKELVTREVALAKLAPNAAGRMVADFGKDAVGWLEMDGPDAGPYEIVLGELVNARGEVTNAYPGACIRCQRLVGEKPAGRYRVPMPPDKLNLRGHDPKAPAILLPERFGVVFPFRYAEIVRGPRATLRQIAVNYPIDMGKSSFDCDNADLVRVYELCKYSILATSFCGVYVDGDRERTPYEADAYINQLDHYAIDDDCSLARKSHEWLMDHPTWPTEWRQHSIKMAWADLMWTGDTRSAAKFYDRLRTEKLMDRFARESDGLLETGGERKKGARPGASDIVDWPSASRDKFEFRPVNAVVNAFYYRNLLELADIARALGKGGDAAEFEARARKIFDAFQAAFFREKSGLYADGEGTDHSSLHANAAALAFGLVPQERVSGVVDFLERKGMACSVYFAQYLLEAFCEVGRADIAVRLMSAHGDKGWVGMMDFGSTISMEAWSVGAKPNLDLNHAWGAAPLNIISRYVVGVTPLEAGFRKVAIRPRLGGLGRVSATVPTVAGPVKVEVSPDRLVFESPSPVEATFAGATRSFPAGRHEMAAPKGCAPAGQPK